MSLLSDLLKEIPTGSVMKVRLEEAEAKFNALETERDILDGKLRNAENLLGELNGEIDKLRHKLSEATTPPAKLGEKGDHLLKAIVKLDKTRFSIHSLRDLNLTKVEVDYYWQHLKDRKFLITSDNIQHTLTQPGRKYAMDHLSD